MISMIATRECVSDAACPNHMREVWEVRGRVARQRGERAEYREVRSEKGRMQRQSERTKWNKQTAK